MSTVVDLGYHPHTFQREIHAKLKRFSLLVCHRRFGKTVAAIMALIDAAVRFNALPDGRFAYIAPQYNQAKSIAWLYLKRYGMKIPGAKPNEAELTLTLPNGNSVRLFGANNPDSLRGLYLDGVVPDEVAQMPTEVWGEILRPALADRKGWALFIGTPKGVNLFSQLYYDHLSDPEWYVAAFDAEMTVDDPSTPLDRAELEILRSGMSDAQFRQEMMCDFSASSDDTLIPIDLVMDATRKHLRADQYGSAPRVMGVDVARFGDDRSVIQKRQGLHSHQPLVFHGMNNMDLASRVAVEIEAFKADTVFIDAGRGEGVIDRLRQLGYNNVLEINFGGKPNSDHYQNKRAEMWFAMLEWLEQGGVIPNDQELIQSLVVPTYGFNKITGRKQLEPKEDIKKRVGFSPDLGDALALTLAMPVRNPKDHGRGGGKALTEYDPLAD